jgi:hypothetical protein
MLAGMFHERTPLKADPAHLPGRAHAAWRRSQWAVGMEAAWPFVEVPLPAVAVFAIAGLFQIIPDAARPVLLAGLGLWLAVALVRGGLAGWRAAKAHGLARLEAASGVPRGTYRSLSDTPTGPGTPTAVAPGQA